MKILFVCTGNTCRSPMLKFMFEDYLARLGVTNISVDCAGLLKQWQGKTVTPEAVKVLEAHGVACNKNYLSKYVDDGTAFCSDCIICVTEECAKSLKKQYPTLCNVISLFELSVGDVQDPYGQGVEAYDKVYMVFEKALPQILEYIQK